MVLTTIMRILTGLISVYMLIIFIRILLSWFQPKGLGRAYDIVYRITEPYLAFFRRFTFLRAGRFDFSPIIAIIVLVVLENITVTLAAFGKITVGIILALIVKALWSAASFLATFYIAILVIRFLGLTFGRNQSSPLWQTLDMMVQPLIMRVTRILKPKRPLNYSTLLAVTSAAMIVLTLIVRFLIRLLAVHLAKLPF